MSKKYYIKKIGESDFKTCSGTSASAYNFEEDFCEDTSTIRLVITKPKTDSSKAVDACKHEFVDWMAKRIAISDDVKEPASTMTCDDTYIVDAPMEAGITQDCFQSIVDSFNDWLLGKDASKKDDGGQKPAPAKDESKDKKDGDKPAPTKDEPKDKKDGDKPAPTKDEPKKMKDLADWTDDDLDKYFDEDIIPV